MRTRNTQYTIRISENFQDANFELEDLRNEKVLIAWGKPNIGVRNTT